jgi:glycosyltransferase involved in cell wall biosynthesis
LEVLVICHSSIRDSAVLQEVASIPLVKILSNKDGTVSENRNQGIRESLGDFVAFLDDDDEWLPKKLEVQLNSLSNQGYDLISCQAQLIGWKNKVVPNEIYSNKERFLDSLYAEWNFGRRKFGIPTPTILVKAIVAKEFLFNTDMQEREDLYFIDQIEQAGYKIFQIESILVKVKSTKPLSHRNSPVSQDLYWFHYLSDRPYMLNWKFLITVALRNRLINFQFFSSLKLIFKALKMSFEK